MGAVRVSEAHLRGDGLLGLEDGALLDEDDGGHLGVGVVHVDADVVGDLRKEKSF